MEIPNQWFEETAEYIKARLIDIPDTVIVLGSGLGILADEIKNPIVIDYTEIPHFPKSTVVGHAGQLICGLLNYVPVLAMSGRFHYYEGYDINQVTYPVRVFAKLGVKNLILTNAAGGVNLNFEPGDLMVIKDHINFSGVSPLRGPNLDEFGPRFPDMSNLYDEELLRIIEECSGEMGIMINEGVYAYLQGPNYETPSEIKALRTLGADAVGMSTVPEAIVGRHSGLKVAAISCITNMAAGILPRPLDHNEVKEVAEFASRKFISLVTALVVALYNEKNNPKNMLGEGDVKYLDGNVDGE
jgi:purine-nucleoside phosphorylase